MPIYSSRWKAVTRDQSMSVARRGRPGSRTGWRRSRPRCWRCPVRDCGHDGLRAQSRCRIRQRQGARLEVNLDHRSSRCRRAGEGPARSGSDVAPTLCAAGSGDGMILRMYRLNAMKLSATSPMGGATYAPVKRVWTGGTAAEDKTLVRKPCSTRVPWTGFLPVAPGLSPWFSCRSERSRRWPSAQPSRKAAGARQGDVRRRHFVEGRQFRPSGDRRRGLRDRAGSSSISRAGRRMRRSRSAN